MELINGIEQLRESHRPSVVSIGNFDGVHRGHQHVIQTLLQQSKRLQAQSTVITFEPLAKEYFMPDSVMRLTSLEERSRLLFEQGVDRVLCIGFDQDFADTSPTDFVQNVLIEGLGVRYLSVGDDFRFGKDRAGDFALLSKMGAEYQFEVSAHETFKLDDQRVSSGWVRDAIAQNDFATAANLLGRPYSIRGEVSRGQQLGRTLNYPTANLVLDEHKFVVTGVYVVRAELNGVLIEGVANIGTRPTVDGKQQRLEVHLFDFDKDIYGQIIDVRFLHKIRDEQKFESLEHLKKQIAVDAQLARDYFAEEAK